MKKKDVTINIIDGNSKSENVYDNVISSMEKMSLNKGEQIEYLKNKISELEQNQKERYDLVILSLICLFSLIIGITFLILNFYTIGSIIVFAACFYGIYKSYSLSSSRKKISFEKFEDIEAIRKIINSKLK